MATTLAVDAMGGDFGIPVTVPAACAMVQDNPDLSIKLVGAFDSIENALGPEKSHPRLEIVRSTEVVGMDESAVSALKNKKNSSLRISIDLVKAGKADACVSAGNTGALMATARFVLKTLPGIDRPAIVSALPRANGHVHILDLGANVESLPEHLLQFGMMGASLVRTLENNPNPTVGLLNIGSEEVKGNVTVKSAYKLFQSSPINFIGYVEGDDIFSGEVDVIVCDGFAGNVALKTSEGLAQMLTKAVREEYMRSLWSRFLGVLSAPVLKAIRARIDHRRYDGAVLVGLSGTVVKSHGGTDEIGFAHAIKVAQTAVSTDLVAQIRDDLSQLHEQQISAKSVPA